MHSHARTGTQSVERAIRLLKAVATRGSVGWRLTDLVDACELDKSTVHRLLECLRAERLIEREATTRRFVPGPLIAELSLSTRAYPAFLAACQASLVRLARATGGAAFVYLASGSEFVVAARVEFRRHSSLLHTVGRRRPLLTSVGGIALLIGMAEAERQAIVAQNVEALERAGKHDRVEALQRMLERSLQEGFASNLQEAAHGVHSYAVTVRDRPGRPVAAISIADVAESLPAEQKSRFAGLLREQAALLEREAVPLLDAVDGAAASRSALFSEPIQ